MNKKIIAIILVLVILLLGGASIYIASQLSTRQAVAPSAPESLPFADETPTFVGSDVCTVSASASAGVCVPSGVITCNPNCPTACGLAASTITTCVNSCGAAATKACPATAACDEALLEGEKLAFKNETANTAGVYTLTTELESVAKNQVYVYSINLTNTSNATATGVTIKDSLKTITDLTFVDAVAGCTWNATDVELTCNTSIKPDETKTFSFRVKAAAGIANGDVITNVAKVSYFGGDPFDLTNDLTVSTVVGCNNTCTTDAECSTGLVCDATSSKCRTATCLTEDDCTCPVAITTIVTSTATPKATATTAPIVTTAPTTEVIVEATPTILPETGIFDFPGIAAFGGGLLLAVIGILLAL